MKENRLSHDLDHIFAQTFPLWEELREQQIFITGGTGFFGCWLLESFLWMNESLNLNAKATILTRSIDKFANKYPHLFHQPSLSFCEGDVKDFEFPAGHFSHIIHAATDTQARLANETALTLFDDLVKGTKHVLEFAKLCRAKKFLLTSSGAVYGKQPENLRQIPESYPNQLQVFDAKASYALGKSAAEHVAYLHALQTGFELKIARCFAFIGPYLPLDGPYAIANFIQDGIEGRTIEVKGDGSPFRSYLYAADLAIWLWTILFCGKSSYPYNVGSDEDYSIHEIAKLVASSFEEPPSVKLMQAKQTSGTIERYVPDISRAREELHLKPHIGLNEAIKLTKDWHLG